MKQFSVHLKCERKENCSQRSDLKFSLSGIAPIFMNQSNCSNGSSTRLWLCRRARCFNKSLEPCHKNKVAVCAKSKQAAARTNKAPLLVGPLLASKLYCQCLLFYSPVMFEVGYQWNPNPNLHIKKKLLSVTAWLSATFVFYINRLNYNIVIKRLNYMVAW